MILSPLLWASLQWNCNILIMIKFIVKFDKVNWQIYFGYCLASPCEFSIISIRKKLSYFINLLSAPKKPNNFIYTCTKNHYLFVVSLHATSKTRVPFWKRWFGAVPGHVTWTATPETPSLMTGPVKVSNETTQNTYL